MQAYLVLTQHRTAQAALQHVKRAFRGRHGAWIAGMVSGLVLMVAAVEVSACPSSRLYRWDTCFLLCLELHACILGMLS